ncbi:MAG: hypothetical protein JSV65_16570 [Armatimonadota bacterium]|nr:MAG: hypothetical protein JSV65_16570 [Armatimonadota bacterium]
MKKIAGSARRVVGVGKRFLDVIGVTVVGIEFARDVAEGDTLVEAADETARRMTFADDVEAGAAKCRQPIDAGLDTLQQRYSNWILRRAGEDPEE